MYRLAVALFAIVCAAAAGVSATAAPAQSALEILHTFAGGTDGSFPYAGVVKDADGALYGTTEGGGSLQCNCGTVYKLIPPGAGGGAWTEQILHVFAGGHDGELPSTRVTLDPAGNIFGTTTYGGSSSLGTVYELSPSGGGGYSYSVIHTFLNLFDGEFPATGLVRAGNDLIGTTEYGGGLADAGSVFELTPPAMTGGAWTKTTLYSFQGGFDGAGPIALIRDADNVLYGTTASGGGAACPVGCGAVFRLARAGGAWGETILYAFPTNTGPESGVIKGPDGTLYGAEMFGGGQFGCSSPTGCGRVYTLTAPTAGGAPWAKRTIYKFTDADGVNPIGGLLMGVTGVIYGTTSLGTPSLGGGTIFALGPPTANRPYRWRYRTLFSTNADPSFGVRDFESALIAGGDGNLYGTAQGGVPTPDAPSPAGVVFRIAK